MLEPKNSRISLLLSFHIFSKLGKACFRPWNIWVSEHQAVCQDESCSPCIHSLLSMWGRAGETKLFFFPILSFCQKWTHLSKMVSLFFIVLKLNFSFLTLQLFLNVWFKNWVDCCYRSTSRLLHIIIQSSALLAANPIFLWIYLKQLEGCARSPESLNLYFGLVVWWQFSVREKWGLYRNWCTLMTKWKRSPGKGILKQINRHMKLFRTPQFNSLCSCPLPPETQARENFYHL